MSYTCGNPKCKREAFLHVVEITINGSVWIVPVYLCHEEECLTKSGATLIFGAQRREEAAVEKKDDADMPEKS